MKNKRTIRQFAAEVRRATVSFFMNPRNLFIVGILLVTALSLSEVLRDRHKNFMIFAESTRMFWSGTAPYGSNWAEAHPELDYFLYGPLFNILFAPFAYLPAKVGPVVWNLFNFTVWFFAIFSLPRLSREDKCRSFLYTLLILGCTQLSFQYNVIVGSIFLFAYTLLERKCDFWAIVLLLVSGFTKVYGFFGLGMLLLYPPPRRFAKGCLWAVLVSAAFILAPAVNMPLGELPGYYGEWFSALFEHKDTRTWMNFFYLRPFDVLLPYRVWVQAGVLALLGGALLMAVRNCRIPMVRLSALAAIMGYSLLFSNSTESHTYVIFLAGYMAWYWTMKRAGALTAADRVLCWAAFIVVVVMPVDVICPVKLMQVFYDVQLNLWLLLVMWLRICCTAFVRVPAAFVPEPAPAQNVKR